MTDGDSKTFRCGWHVDLPAAAGYFRPDTHAQVVARRGEFRAVFWPPQYSAMGDEEFDAIMTDGYRQHVFEQLQQDLSTLARHLIGILQGGYDLGVTDVPLDDVKAALYRWQRTDRDIEKPVKA